MYVKTVNVAHSGVGLYNIYYKQNIERFNNPFIVCVQCEGYNKSTNKTVQEVISLWKTKKKLRKSVV